MSAVQIRGVWALTCPVGTVWEVITDPTTWPQWWPAISDVEQSIAVDHQPGARLTFQTRRPLRPFTVTLRIVEVDAPSLLGLRLVDGPLAGDGSFRLDADQHGSTVRWEVALTVRSLLFKPLEPILRNASRAAGRQRLNQAGHDLARLCGGTLRDDPATGG